MVRRAAAERSVGSVFAFPSRLRVEYTTSTRPGKNKVLTLYRRHLKTCPHRAGDRKYTKCQCPIHCDGFIKDERIRESMDTVNCARAMRRMVELEEEATSDRVRKPVADAAQAFLSDRTIEPSTGRKYKRTMARLTRFMTDNSLAFMDQVQLEHLDSYRATRQLSALSWSKELQLLRTFFSFCLKRKWCAENPAKDMTMPADPKPKPREPYTAEEVTRILAACDSFGRGPYERLRAKAMILLMRRYGLRVSDVATLERDRVRDGRIFLHALKNGAALRLPLWPDGEQALEIVPMPMGAQPNCKYYFWTGLGDRDGHIKPLIDPYRLSFARVV